MPLSTKIVEITYRAGGWPLKVPILALSFILCVIYHVGCDFISTTVALREFPPFAAKIDRVELKDSALTEAVYDFINEMSPGDGFYWDYVNRNW